MVGMHLEEAVQTRVVLESLLLRDRLSSQEGRLNEEEIGNFPHWLWRTGIRQVGCCVVISSKLEHTYSGGRIVKVQKVPDHGVPNHNWYSYKITLTAKAQRTSEVGTESGSEPEDQDVCCKTVSRL